MSRKLVLILVGMATACSKGPEADLQYIVQARSLAAEWALVNEQAGQGKLTDTYVKSMHKWLRKELRTSSASLTQPESTYGKEIEALLKLPDDASPDVLRARSETLKHIEDNLESA
jgi:hypothetical protein